MVFKSIWSKPNTTPVSDFLDQSHKYELISVPGITQAAFIQKATGNNSIKKKQRVTVMLVITADG